ncbi:MAG: GTPase, partial [Verrucomicrobiota bacterium]
MKPVLALVGRPNVGKSTLFNRLTKTRDAIVADFAGLTRDRHYGNARFEKHDFIVIDTGGFEPTADSGIYKEMARQTQQAVAEADVVVFVVDARGGISAQDHDIANYLRRLGKPTILVANKAEGMTDIKPESPSKQVDLTSLLVGAAISQRVPGCVHAHHPICSAAALVFPAPLPARSKATLH